MYRKPEVYRLSPGMGRAAWAAARYFPGSRLDHRGPQPAEATKDVAAQPPVHSVQVRTASDDDIRKAIKRVTRDHEALIKALAK